MFESFLLIGPVLITFFAVWLAYELSKRFINKILFVGIVLSGYALFAFVRLYLSGYTINTIVNNPTFGIISIMAGFSLAMGLVMFYSDKKAISCPQKEKEPDYKQLIHDIADAMHNLGETPLRKGGSDGSVDLSPEEAHNIRSLMRTLRTLARTDMGPGARIFLPYVEVVALLNEVAQKNPNPNVSRELIDKIESEGYRMGFNSIREIIKSMSIKVSH